MNMIRHNNKRMQIIVSDFPSSIANSIANHIRDLGHTQVSRPSRSGVQNPIHRHESLP